jgi:type IV secretory pathway VirB10-like protein
MLRSSILILILLLVGCEQEPQKVKQPKKSVFTGQHYALQPEEPEAPPPPPPPKPEPLTDDFFPDDRDIEATQKAINRLSKIRARLREQNNIVDAPRKTITTKTIYSFKDKDYGRIKVPTDKSSYPVDRDRILTKDMNINAILTEGINSQIAGRVIAQVDRLVLSPSKKYILLPAGTKIICMYEGLAKTGQTRLALNCKQLIRPDGTSVVLSSVEGADMSGKQGLIGRIDNRLFQQYGGAFLVSSISALAQASSDRFANPSISNSASAFSQEFSKITAKTIEKYLDLRPIITIEAGAKIILKPMQDITFIEPEKITQHEEQHEDN